MLRWLFALIVLAGVALGLILGVLNADPVTLDLGVIRWTASLGAIVAAATGAGLLFGIVLGGLAARSGARKHVSNSAKRNTRVPSSSDE